MGKLEFEQSEIFELLQNPKTANPLAFENDALVDQQTGEQFMIRNEIPVILSHDDVFGWNKKQQKAYDWGSYLYDLLYTFNLANLDQWLQEIADIMEVRTKEYVLETSVGTGQQIRNLKRHGIDANFFGNDISFGMLRKCKKNMRNWNIDIGLVQANAEALPFKNSLFDVVFHIGGFNFFNDKECAIEEMIRVAKPGAKLYIVDETADIMNELSIFSRFMPDPDTGVFEPPVELIPDDMSHISCRDLFDGKFWMISFQKPCSTC